MQIFRVSKQQGERERYSDSLLPWLCCVCFSIQELIVVSIGRHFTTPVVFSNRFYYRSVYFVCVSLLGAGFSFVVFFSLACAYPYLYVRYISLFAYDQSLPAAATATPAATAFSGKNQQHQNKSLLRETFFMSASNSTRYGY